MIGRPLTLPHGDGRAAEHIAFVSRGIPEQPDRER